MADTAGLRHWYVPDAFIPVVSTPPELSHESICVLNPSETDAELTVTVYFADREPETSAPIILPARRDAHLRTSVPEQVGGLRIEPGIPYGIEVASASDLQVQYSRLDTTQAASTLMTAMPSPR
ncbi:MAG: sensory rhodopsin transducer [Propionicimonas sp.]|nr:sensory rhodopsin transducer [Propionicimonas sp.]